MKFILAFDSGTFYDDRIIILFSEFKIKSNEKLKVVMVDETFKSSTPGLFQILVITGLMFGRNFPCIYI
jgi:hypothetical protein